MALPAHVRCSLPKWQFWSWMNRELTNEKGEAIGRFKKSWTQTSTLLDSQGNVLVKPKLQLGVKADLYDAKDKILGSVKLVRIQAKKLFPDVRELWGIADNGDPYIYLWPVEKHKVAFDVDSVDLAHADAAYQVVRGDTVIGTLVCGSGLGGLYENFNLVFEKGTSEGDRLLSTALMGYKVHNLLK